MPPSRPLPEDVRQALAAGKKVQALRLLRTRTGFDLRQALAAIESGQLPSNAGQLRQAVGDRSRMRNEPGPRISGLSPGEVPRSRSRAAVWITVGLLLVVLWLLLSGDRSGTRV